MTLSRKPPLKPFMAYIEEDQYARMRKFSTKARVPMSHLIREAIDMRIAHTAPYIDGYNAGLKKAIAVVAGNKAAEMRFPSGKSFAELINDDLLTAMMEKNDEVDRNEESVQGV